MKEILIGKMEKICRHCKAKKWAEEPSGFCCHGGKVALPELEDPPELIKSLILGTHSFSKNFLEKTRKYNTLFQMTSFGTKEVREGNFMPTFKIQGQIYHYIGSSLSIQEKEPEFLQIYFISEADQISRRLNIILNLERELIELIQMSWKNMYVIIY